MIALFLVIAFLVFLGALIAPLVLIALLIVIPIVIVGAIVYGIYKIITGTTKIITGTTKRRKFAKRFENPNSEYYQQHESGRPDWMSDDEYEAAKEDATGRSRFENPTGEYYRQRENSRSEAYEEMGLSITATNEQAHQKYREFAKELHPDVNPDPQATQKFMKIKQAYETILELNQQMA
jgi:hypothetical protein